MIRYILVKRDESANEFEVQMEWHWFIFKRRLNKNKFIIENKNAIIMNIDHLCYGYFIINKYGDYIPVGILYVNGTRELRCVSNHSNYIDNILALPLM